MIFPSSSYLSAYALEKAYKSNLLFYRNEINILTNIEFLTLENYPLKNMKIFDNILSKCIELGCIKSSFCIKSNEDNLEKVEDSQNKRLKI
jgi:hypothetical protein